MLQTNIGAHVLLNACDLIHTLNHLHIHSYIHKGNQGDDEGPVS